MVRRCAFLLGCGNVAGHPLVDGISVEDAVAMVRTPFPSRTPSSLHLRSPSSSHRSTGRCWLSSRRVLGPRDYNYLTLFLGFIRFAHFWTESHPQLRVEDDIEQLLAQQRTLAQWVVDYPDQVEMELARAKAELRELEQLRGGLCRCPGRVHH